MTQDLELRLRLIIPGPDYNWAEPPDPTPYDSHNGSTMPKQAKFDAVLAENRGTKVIRLARDGSQRDRDPERMDYEVDYGASPISRMISLTEEDEREDGEYTGGRSSVHTHLPEGAMPTSFGMYSKEKTHTTVSTLVRDWCEC